ncbi:MULTISPECIES: hypothetical protein [unclassified Microcoleus]
MFCRVLFRRQTSHLYQHGAMSRAGNGIAVSCFATRDLLVEGLS